jgi:hypothetical protein
MVRKNQTDHNSDEPHAPARSAQADDLSSAPENALNAKKPRFPAAFRCLISRRKTGAGEAIRTLDPNLGKVVLYP